MLILYKDGVAAESSTYIFLTESNHNDTISIDDLLDVTEDTVEITPDVSPQKMEITPLNEPDEVQVIATSNLEAGPKRKQNWMKIVYSALFPYNLWDHIKEEEQTISGVASSYDPEDVGEDAYQRALQEQSQRYEGCLQHDRNIC